MEFFFLKCVAILDFILLSLVTGHHEDQECAHLRILNRSSVCVCNSTYCDTIMREIPVPGRYFAYISSQSGLRFRKSTFFMRHYRQYSRCLYTLDINPSKTYQTIEGFGGAVTDSAGINWQSLKDPDFKQSLIDAYFSKYGLEYNMLRVPIGGTDFSPRPYAYNEQPENDVTLTNFTLSREDLRYKIPMIKACQKASKTKLHIIASTWSPPAWMKDSHRLVGYSRLKKEYYQTYADYHCMFIEKYEKHDIPIWGITTTNEPINGLMSLGRVNSLGWSIKGMGEWIKTNLGPTMRDRYPDIKIIGVDDRRFTVPLWFNILLLEYPEALKYLDGVAVHYSFDKITPASILGKALAPYPGKFIIATEASEGANSEMRVDLGSWERAENYAINIIEDLNNNVIGWIDWNLCLNMNGGPNWARNFVDSAVIVNVRRKEFYKQPMFYIMGHFSKFIPRGSKRIAVTEWFNCEKPLHYVAFLTPYNTIVIVLYNEGDERPVALKLHNTEALMIVESKSILTVEFPNQWTRGPPNDVRPRNE